MVITTRAQRQSIYRKWMQCPSPLPRTHELHDTMSYRQFRKSVHPTFGCDGAVTVEWCGMWLCIEKDGYTHS